MATLVDAVEEESEQGVTTFVCRLPLVDGPTIGLPEFDDPRAWPLFRLQPRVVEVVA